MTDVGYHHRLLTALFWACCVVWAALAGFGCYLFVRAPDWIGWVMLR